MKLLLKCSCGWRLRAADEHAKKMVECPSCGERLSISEAQPAPPVRKPRKSQAPSVPPPSATKPQAESATPLVRPTTPVAKRARLPAWMWLLTAAACASVVIIVVIVASVSGGDSGNPRRAFNGERDGACS